MVGAQSAANAHAMQAQFALGDGAQNAFYQPAATLGPLAKGVAVATSGAVPNVTYVLTSRWWLLRVRYFFLNASWTCFLMSLKFWDSSFSSSFVRILNGTRITLFSSFTFSQY